MIASTMELSNLAEKSRFRNFSPEALLAAAAATAFAFSFVRRIPSAGLCLAVAVALVLAARAPVRPLLRRLAGANVFLALVWLTLPLTLPGGEAVRLALLLTLKCNAIFLSFLALAGGLDSFAVCRALEGLRLPAKLVFLVFFTSRHIHAVREEWLRLRTAAALRAFVPGTNIITYRTIGNMLGLTVVRSLARSRRVYDAMLLRGFDGQFRTIAEAGPGRADALLAVVFFVALVAVLLLDAALGPP